MPGDGALEELDLTELMGAVEGTEVVGEEGGHGHPAVTMVTSSREGAADDVDTTKWFEDMSEEDFEKLDQF